MNSNYYQLGSQQRPQGQSSLNSYIVDPQMGSPVKTVNLSDLLSSSLGQENESMRDRQLHQLLVQQQQLSSATISLQQRQHMPAQPASQPKPQKKMKEPMLKTPLSLLNEVCAKAKTLPVFTLEETGPVHMRSYSCTVKVDTNGFTCEANGSGKTKKDAKQEAAKSLLVKMDDDVEQYLIPTVSKEEPVISTIEVDPEPPGNPVGNLNDLCTKLKRLPPEYEDISDIGKPHERVFTVACKLGSHVVETGRGRSKKTAKKVAAYRVHKRVMELLTNESDGTTMLKDDDDLIDKLNSLTLVSKTEAKKITDDWRLHEWVTTLKNRSGPKLDQFKDPANTTLRTDPVKFLNEIAEEQRFKLEFMELIDNRDSLKTYLLAVSSGNQPITVLLGSSTESKTKAKKNAAENFLEMLRVKDVGKVAKKNMGYSHPYSLLK